MQMEYVEMYPVDIDAVETGAVEEGDVQIKMTPKEETAEKTSPNAKEIGRKKLKSANEITEKLSRK